jgi:hypothetical protein
MKSTSQKEKQAEKDVLAIAEKSGFHEIYFSKREASARIMLIDSQVRCFHEIYFSKREASSQFQYAGAIF